VRLYSDFVALVESDDCFVPKHHIMFHVLDKTAFQGNPTLYSTWLDEALNKVLKSACRTTSQITFERSVLFRMREILNERVGKRPFAKRAAR
jgi:hypothetical protein